MAPSNTTGRFLTKSRYESGDMFLFLSSSPAWSPRAHTQKTPLEDLRAGFRHTGLPSTKREIQPSAFSRHFSPLFDLANQRRAGSGGGKRPQILPPFQSCSIRMRWCSPELIAGIFQKVNPLIQKSSVLLAKDETKARLPTKGLVASLIRNRRICSQSPPTGECA